MYNKQLILALAASSLLATATVHAEQPNGWFVNANAGDAHYKAHVDDLGSATESDTAFMINAGWRDDRILGFTAFGGAPSMVTKPSACSGMVSAESPLPWWFEQNTAARSSGMCSAPSTRKRMPLKKSPILTPR